MTRRLIDADAVYMELVKMKDFGELTAKKAIRVVRNAPTIEAEPVRHAKNIGTDFDETDQFVCSECGIELQDWHRVERDEDDGDETYYGYRFRYCPHCGARIVEEDTEPKEEP